jgi:hypothetical protein
MSNVKEAILSMKLEVDSICETIKILIRESENAKNIDDLDYLSSFAVKKLFPIVQDLVVNKENKKICELACRLKEILNSEGIKATIAKTPDHVDSYQDAIAQLPLMIGDLYNEFRKGYDSLSSDEKLILTLRSLGRKLHEGFDSLSSDEQMVLIVKCLMRGINSDFDTLSSDKQNELIVKSLFRNFMRQVA